MTSRRTLNVPTDGPSTGQPHVAPHQLDLTLQDRQETFRVWRQRWNSFFRLSGLSQAAPVKQYDVLVSCLTDGTLKLIVNNLATGSTPDSQKHDVERVLNALERYAEGEINETLEHYKLLSRVQQPNEKFDDFYSDLRVLSSSCSYCSSCTNALLRDCIVRGVRDTAVQEKLLIRVHNVSLDNAVLACQTSERNTPLSSAAAAAAAAAAPPPSAAAPPASAQSRATASTSTKNKPSPAQNRDQQPQKSKIAARWNTPAANATAKTPRQKGTRLSDSKPTAAKGKKAVQKARVTPSSAPVMISGVPRAAPRPETDGEDTDNEAWDSGGGGGGGGARGRAAAKSSVGRKISKAKFDQVAADVAKHKRLLDGSANDDQFLLPFHDDQFAHGCEHGANTEYVGILEDFGGYRFPDEMDDERESSELLIRPMPFYACLHRMCRFEEDFDDAVFVRHWNEKTQHWVTSEEETVPTWYAICVRGPFNREGVSPVQVVLDPSRSAEENMKRVTGALKFDASETLEERDIQEVTLELQVITEKDARMCVGMLRDHVYGVYYRSEAGRLDRWRVHYRDLARSDSCYAEAENAFGMAMNAAHRFAAHHIFTFFNCFRGPFQVDLHHLRVRGEEAEVRLKHAMVRASREQVDLQDSERYLEVIVGKGLHSANSKAKLIPRVRLLLETWRTEPPSGVKPYKEVREINKGCLLVRFALYRGPSPCFGWLYCSEVNMVPTSKKGDPGDHVDGESDRVEACLHTWDSTRVVVDIDRKTKEAKKVWEQRCHKCYTTERGKVTNLSWIIPVMLSRTRPQHRQARRYIKVEGSASQHRPYKGHEPSLCALCEDLRAHKSHTSCDQLPKNVVRYAPD